MDYSKMTFTYLLKVPNPTIRDIYPIYRIYNVGFHTPHNQRDKREVPVLFKAPFPTHAVIRGTHGMMPISLEYCQQAPGLYKCDIDSLSRNIPRSACLDLLMNEGKECAECDSEKECLD